MNDEKENDRHRELFESPIHPLQINMVPPYADVSNKMFSLQLNGEVLWKCKDISGNLGSAFALIQRSLQPLGYQLEDASRDRVGHALACAIRKLQSFQMAYFSAIKLVMQPLQLLNAIHSNRMMCLFALNT